jgi:hypoxanthine phosphoribosyltransferase
MKMPPSAPAIVAVPETGLPCEPEEGPLHDRLRGDPRVERVLIPASALRRRVASLARELRAAEPERRELHLVVVLKGGMFFAKDLGEALFALDGTPVRFSMIKASTYGAEIKEAGETARRVRIELRPNGVRGTAVILVEDLLDQGFTLSRLRTHLLEEEGAAAVRLCVLLDKRLENPPPAVRRNREALHPDHVGFQVPDRWVAGYGIDAAEDFRNLPFIVTVNERHYRNERG